MPAPPLLRLWLRLPILWRRLWRRLLLGTPARNWPIRRCDTSRPDLRLLSHPGTGRADLERSTEMPGACSRGSGAVRKSPRRKCFRAGLSCRLEGAASERSLGSLLGRARRLTLGTFDGIADDLRGYRQPPQRQRLAGGAGEIRTSNTVARCRPVHVKTLLPSSAGARVFHTELCRKPPEANTGFHRCCTIVVFFRYATIAVLQQRRRQIRHVARVIGCGRGCAATEFMRS
jgi:hypothetical protein